MFYGFLEKYSTNEELITHYKKCRNLAWTTPKDIKVQGLIVNSQRGDSMIAKKDRLFKFNASIVRLSRRLIASSPGWRTCRAVISHSGPAF